MAKRKTPKAAKPRATKPRSAPKRVKAVKPRSALAYERHREDVASRSRERSKTGREIGPLPGVADPRRRARCERNFRLFCETYFADRFFWPWSEDHLDVLAEVEAVVLDGGLFAHALPRGGGKSTICEAACLWAILYGHHPFVMVVAADQDLARTVVDSLKLIVETNALLAEDFPEVCYPISKLEGIHHRAGGQTVGGEHTRMRWKQDEIVFPTVRGSASSGAIVRTRGIEGRIRGTRFTRADGVVVRPSLLLIDDPQTDESAASPQQVEKRERTISGAVLGSGGVGRAVAALMPLTVIRPGDLADRYLDRELHPEWRGKRSRLMRSMPSNTDLWAEYGKLWHEHVATGDISLATEFYREHCEAMDEGAVASWPERRNQKELSAIQHAMNLRLERGDAAFFAEYQNEPLEEASSLPVARVEDIVARLNGLDQGVIPTWATHLTAAIDPHARAHYWVVTAWGEDATGTVVAYGTVPRQPERYFGLTTLPRPLEMECQAGGVEAHIRHGLNAAWELLSGEFRREDGVAMRVSRCVVDANWATATNVVYDFCRSAPSAAMLLPAHGTYVGAAGAPFEAHRPKPGDRAGAGWRIPAAGGRRGLRHVVFDTNTHKSWVQARLVTPVGSPGAMTLFGTSPGIHRLFAEHMVAQTPVPTRAQLHGVARAVDEWRLRQPGLDDHWWDCLVMCAVGASIEGVSAPGSPASARRSGGKLSFTEWQRKRQAGRDRQRRTKRRAGVAG